MWPSLTSPSINSVPDFYVVGINTKTTLSLAVSLVIMHVYYTKIEDAPPLWIVRLCARSCRTEPRISRKESDNQETGNFNTITCSPKLSNGHLTRPKDEKMDDISVWKKFFRMVELVLFVAATAVNAATLIYLLIRFE